MERKTKITAENGKHDLFISREFDLPLELLFKAYEDVEIVEQWMNTKVIKQENKNHGSWHIQTSDPAGNVVFEAQGTFHEFTPNLRIIRTFEMKNAPFGAQLEFMEFEKISEEKSKLTIQSIYRTVELRDQMLKLPFEYGINMAHDRLQEVLTSLK